MTGSSEAGSVQGRTADLPLFRRSVAPGTSRAVSIVSPLVRRLESRSHSSVTTLDHAWIIRKNSFSVGPAQRQRKERRDKMPELVLTTTAKLNSNDQIIQATPCVNLPENPRYADAFVELVGWLYTEGSYYLESRYFALWQSERVNPDHVAVIRNEGPCIGKEDLREVQGHQPPRGGSRDLRKRKAQAAPGLGGSGIERKPPRDSSQEQFVVHS